MRAVLHILIPLLIPLVVWLGWVIATRGKPMPQWWNEAPWPWIGLAGVILLMGSLGTWALMGGDEPGGQYTPPSFEDGQIQPSRIDR